MQSDKSSKQMAPSALARYTCLSILMAVFGVWHKLTFLPEEEGTPCLDFPLHSYKVPLALTASYLISLPLLNKFVSTFLAPRYDMKSLLFESMVFYNVAQVCMNVWMVWRFVDAVANRGHPFIGSTDAVGSGTTFAIWVHYTNKYLEFLDTYFMVLRGKMEQVSFYKKTVNLLLNCFIFLNLFLFHTGFIFTCISSHNNCMGLVGSTQPFPRRRFLLRSSSQLYDSCNDVLLLRSCSI